MRKSIENIEIKDPPIEELKKKTSCLKSSCLTGCGFIVIFIIGSLILLKYSTGSKPKEIKTVPENFPKSIPVYDKDSVEKINFISGAEISKVQEMASFIPKLLLSPILMLWDKKSNDSEPTFTWDKFKKIIKEQNSDHRDTVEINWKDLPAEPRFIEKYYQNELEKNKYEISIINNKENNFEFTFKKDKVGGVFYLTDNGDKKGTDNFSLTVKIPRE